MGDSIYRRVVKFETVEVPEGKKPCPSCRGKGYTSAYERGWRSLVHSPKLAAEEPCMICGATGLVDIHDSWGDEE